MHRQISFVDCSWTSCQPTLSLGEGAIPMGWIGEERIIEKRLYIVALLWLPQPDVL